MAAVHNLQALLELIAVDPVLSQVHREVRHRLASSNDAAHDLEHLHRVALWTLRTGESRIDKREGISAALLHDIVNVPKDSPDRARASEVCAEEARVILEGLKFPAAGIERVATAIVEHSFSRGLSPSTPLSEALQDADRLDSLGAFGIMRTFSTSVFLRSRYYNALDPWAERRELDDKGYAVDHFFAKLFTLGATMSTPVGKEEAARRIPFLVAFLEELGSGIGHPFSADLQLNRRKLPPETSPFR